MNRNIIINNMRKPFKPLLISAAVLLSSTVAYAASSHSYWDTTVAQVLVVGNYLCVELSTTAYDGQQNVARFDLRTPNGEAAKSVAMAAFLAGKTVRVNTSDAKVGGCWRGNRAREGRVIQVY